MTATNVPPQAIAKPLSKTGGASQTFTRVAKYTIVRVVALFLTVAVAVYLTIIIANMGGYVDEIIKGRIDGAISGRVMGGWLRDEPTEKKFEIIEQTRQAMYEAEGLNEPFLMRTFRWLGQGLTLNWGESKNARSLLFGGYTGKVQDLVLEKLPRTLLIFGTANLFLFLTSVFLALSLSKRHGGWLDKMVITLSPMGAAPAWAYGIILNVIFLRLFANVTSGGAFDAWPSEFSLAYLPIILKHMFLPFLAIFVSGFFYSLYAWRSYFLLYSSEDHVEMAKARGLSSRTIERRYILRPGLPAVLTSFALMLIVLWQEVIALEKFFNVAGIGRLFYQALRSFDIPVILGLVVTFAYLLAITVFVLDIAYAIVDPRVKLASEGRTVGAVSRKKRRIRLGQVRFRFWPQQKPARLQKAEGNPGSDPSPFTAGRARAPGKATTLSRLAGSLRRGMGSLKDLFLELANYPSAVFGLAIIVALICASIATVILIPYEEAIALWRGEHNVWYQNPKKAPPEWVNLFRREDLPKTLVMDSRDAVPTPLASSSLVGVPGGAGMASKSVTVVSEGMTEILLSFPFDYPYGGFPQDLGLYLKAQYDKKKPQVSLTLLTPDGRESKLGTFSMQPTHTYYVSQDKALQRKLDGQSPQKALFTDPAGDGSAALKGPYELRVSGLVFEEEADLDAELVLFGQVYGVAGTDHERRDLMVALLWGMPVALSFGLLAAVGTSASTIVIAGLGAWYGGWVDNLVQRITEVNMVLPFLPVSIMIYILYSKSFWAILGVTVLLSIFGSAIKNYRAVFLQIKEAGYIEAAQAYGAGNRRIILRYLIPRIMPIMIPQLVILIPSYVFLEATLAFLEVSDPILPTWGKLIVEALSYGTHSGDYHMVLEPAALLMLTGFAFAMVGFALERIFEPRLRER
jgi:peptide/nickel transport system permease protein